MNRRIRRSHNVAMPLVWGVLMHEWWGVPRALTWDCWQALASCPWTEVVTFRQKLLLWPTITSGRAAAISHGVTPQGVLDILEMLVRDRRLSRREAAQIEDRLLACVDAHGAWKG